MGDPPVKVSPSGASSSFLPSSDELLELTSHVMSVIERAAFLSMALLTAERDGFSGGTDDPAIAPPA